MKTKHIITIGTLLIALGVLGRVLPHPWNMTPVAAIALLAGVHLGKRAAVLVPLSAMFLGDLMLGFYDLSTMAVVYASMAIAGLFAYATREKRGMAVFFARPVLASLIFFFTTNAAVWAFGTMYPHTVFGLVASYVAGLPFYGRQLLGDVLYTGLLFGVYDVAVRHIKSLKLQTEKVKPLIAIGRQ